MALARLVVGRWRHAGLVGVVSSLREEYQLGALGFLFWHW